MENQYFKKFNLRGGNQSLIEELREIAKFIGNMEANERNKHGILDLLGIGFQIPLSHFENATFPKTQHFFSFEPLREIMNPLYVRLLTTNPQKPNPDNPSGKDDYYFPHVDKKEGDILISSSLNFSIEGCNEESVVRWHTLTDPKNTTEHAQVRISNDQLSHSIDAAMIQDEFDINLICVDKYHSLENNSGQKRTIMGWHCRPEYSWQEVQDKLSQFQLFD